MVVIIITNEIYENIYEKQHKFIDDVIVDCLNKKSKKIILIEPINITTGDVKITVMESSECKNIKVCFL